MFDRRKLPLVVLISTWLAGPMLLRAESAFTPSPDELAQARRFAAARFEGVRPPGPGLVVELNNRPIELNSHYQKPLKIGNAEFAAGISCHAPSKITVYLPGPAKKLTAKIGLDNNPQTSGGRGSVVFSIGAAGREIFRSEVHRPDTPATPVEVDLKGAAELVLAVGDAGDGIGWDQADWADAQVELADGKTTRLSDLPILSVADGLFASDPPFSFTYDGKPSSEFLGTWKTERQTRKIDDLRTGHTVTYSDPAGGLSIRCEAVEYRDYPTVEWTLHFKNTGTADTPIIKKIQSLDVCWQAADDGEFLLHHNVGSLCGPTDYTPLETVLGGGQTKRIGAAGGRSTNSDLSYFNIQHGGDQGLILAVGWPGQWAADFARDLDWGLGLRAGQELTHFKLLPNEEIRTPLSVLQFWKGGDWIRAQNIWRRWMIAHNMPRPAGKLPSPQLLAYSGGVTEEMYKATEENQKMFLDRYLAEGIKLDYWWIDAGWYPCDPVGWPKVGTWEVDKRRFPNGLRAISDHAHSKGLKMVLWFEPERVAAGTWLAENHPEWVLGGKGGGLLNFGNPEALSWVTEHMDEILTGQGIDLYRQDFNMDPLDYWRAADTPDRQGITEIRHITGLLKYWDELQRRHPGMLMDECASGGRRNDIEMMRRAVPMWRSDKTIEPVSQQCITYGISMWIPFYGTGTAACADCPYYVKGKTPVQPYAFWSTAVPSLNLLFDVREKELDYALVRQLTTQWREVMPYYYGDYYPLTKTSQEQDVWIGWQFDRPEQGDGIVQVFRRNACIYESARLKLRGLDPKAKYRITRIDSAGQSEISGQELLQKGLPVAIDECPGAAVFKYQSIAAAEPQAK